MCDKKIKFRIDREKDILKELENFIIFDESNAINILELQIFGRKIMKVLEV